MIHWETGKKHDRIDEVGPRKNTGTPGTGKPTTIFHLIDCGVPVGEKALITCTRNVAMESITEKMTSLKDRPTCVFGPKEIIGLTARKHLLEEQIGAIFEKERVAKT